MGYNPLKCLYGSKIFPQRYVVVIFISLAILIAYGQRVNISMVIAEMGLPSPKSNTSTKQCNRTKAEDLSEPKQLTGTEWTQEMQGILLSGFFVGYMVFQIPGGILGDHFGGRYILTSSILISSACTVLFPAVVDYLPFEVVVFCRILIGCSQASLFPNCTTLMSRWIPQKERAFMGGITFAAGALGIILGKLISGLVYVICGDEWRPVFYIWGLIGLIWYILALLYMFSDPKSHPFVSDKERDTLAELILPREKGVKLNVIKMIFDPAVLALFMGQFGHDYLIFFLSTSMPKFFKDVHHLEMKDNMWASSIPYTLMWFSSVLTGNIADRAIKKGSDVALIRKIYTTIASVFPSICLLLIPYMECNEIAVIALMCLSLLTMGPFFSGLKVNILDVSHNYSGLLMAIVNGLGALSGVINPPIIGFFATENTFEQWKVIMWLMFTVATVTNIAYIIWGKAERREWDMNEEDRKKSKELKASRKAEKKAEKERKKAAKAGS